MEEKTSEPVWIVYCDGAWGASGAGAGAVISSPSGAKLRYAARLDFRTTSNVAEYEAVLLGLRKARALGARRVILKTDSQVVAGHIDKRFQAREPKLIKYMAAVRSMEKHFLGFTVKSISRNDNFKADDLAKAVAQRIPTPPDVFLSRIKSASCRRTFPGEKGKAISSSRSFSSGSGSSSSSESSPSGEHHSSDNGAESDIPPSPRHVGRKGFFSSGVVKDAKLIKLEAMNAASLQPDSGEVEDAEKIMLSFIIPELESQLGACFCPVLFASKLRKLRAVPRLPKH
ncbi:hypothetical protein ACQ4PT_046658 [Festuca glaucescens]